MPAVARLPDFLIIGAMKCGTTTLLRWLESQPEVCTSQIAEPNFFSNDAIWARGLEWYSSLFAAASHAQVLGEKSPAYTSPDRAPIAAERIAQVLPGIRLVFMVRHPEDRIRSQYRHLRIIGRESDPLDLAVRRRASYAARSMYYSCLAPYIELFPREQILVVRLEDLVASGSPGWARVLEHLGLARRPPPDRRHNASEELGLYRLPPRVVQKSVALRRLIARLPAPVQRIGRRIVQRRGPEFRRMLEQSRGAVPKDVLEPVWADIARLESWLGVNTPLWERK
jgi:hypothetical protein